MSTNTQEIRELTLDEIETVSGGVAMKLWSFGFDVNMVVTPNGGCIGAFEKNGGANLGLAVCQH